MFHISRDQLWKAILEDLFDEFLRWFYEPHLLEIDFQRPFEFLDQELQKIYPEAASQARRVDKLVKVGLKNGADSWFLLHVEAQSYPDPDFSERMYVYQYRIRDLYNREVTALAILADDHPNYLPEAYRYEFMGTSLVYRYNTCKVSQLNPATLENSENLFALVLATAWYGLRQNRGTDEQQLVFKIQLVKRLLQHAVPRERIRRLLEFIKFYAKFDRAELYDDFEKVIQPNRKKMGILELVEQETIKYYKKVGRAKGLEQGRAEGMAEGRAEGMAEGRAEGMAEGRAEGMAEGRAEGKQEGLKEAIARLIRKGLSNEQITDLLEVPDAMIEQVRLTLA